MYKAKMLDFTVIFFNKKKLFRIGLIQNSFSFLLLNSYIIRTADNTGHRD